MNWISADSGFVVEWPGQRPCWWTHAHQIVDQRSGYQHFAYSLEPRQQQHRGRGRRGARKSTALQFYAAVSEATVCRIGMSGFPVVEWRWYDTIRSGLHLAGNAVMVDAKGFVVPRVGSIVAPPSPTSRHPRLHPVVVNSESGLIGAKSKVWADFTTRPAVAGSSEGELL